ncbi:hypothetical protein ACN27E_16650 [Mycobacterium sp. WMMD1722]|uniref:hypothetical protein n=1 Tax=Mycobacterium sp. WMMD1722 TaxID=3404117 RepID=UPI003BF50ED7
MEGDAGTRQLNPTSGGQERSDPGSGADADETPDTTVAVSPDDTTESAPDGKGRRVSRLGRGWLNTICALLLLLTAGAAVGGYLALRTHNESVELASDEVRAVQAAKDCVAATQAPDTTAMTTGQAKIIECSTGDFGAQAALYSGMLVDAYRAANVQVQVSDMRAAVEKHNGDGSIDVLVAVRVKVTNSETADQEQGYRLRVQMAPADGTYKVAKLDQVTS